MSLRRRMIAAKNKPAAAGCLLRISKNLRALFGSVRLRVLTVKALDAAGRIYQLLFPGEERVAVRADFQADVALVGRTGSKHVAARAMHAHFVIRGVNSCLHVALDLSCETLILQEMLWSGNRIQAGEVVASEIGSGRRGQCVSLPNSRLPRVRRRSRRVARGAGVRCRL